MADTDRTVAVLETVGLFQGFERSELERLVGRGHVIDFARGATLFREEEHGGGLYVVLTGSVRITKAVPDRADEAMAVAPAGDFFGEMALIDDQPRSATAVAAADCRVFFLKKEDFLDLTYADPALGSKVLWALCRTFSRRLRETTNSMVALFKVCRAM